VLVYAPGSGADLRDGFGRWAARSLAEAGIGCLRFQFPYSEAGRRIPDRPPVLEATWRAAVETARQYSDRVVVGGRSMGGRIASQIVAQGVAVEGLALFAYPLHPPGRPDQLRDAHLDRIAVPTLFISGTNDVFGTPDELRRAANRVPGAVLHFLEGADHSYRAPKRLGRSQEELWREAIATTIAWLLSAGRTMPPP
jgi:predicted alpha/beta-hydrolase family hydrolase